jgi:hypothetical protein
MGCAGCTQVINTTGTLMLVKLIPGFDSPPMHFSFLESRANILIRMAEPHSYLVSLSS